MNMDGWNQYMGGNYGNLIGLVPPQQSNGYKNESNYGYSSQMSQASSQSYNNGSYEEWQGAYNVNTFQLYQGNTYSVPSSYNNQVSMDTLLSKNDALIEKLKRYVYGNDTRQGFQPSLSSYEPQNTYSMPTSNFNGGQVWNMPNYQMGNVTSMQNGYVQGNFQEECPPYGEEKSTLSTLEDQMTKMFDFMKQEKEENERRFEYRKQREEEDDRRFEALERQMSQMISERNTLYNMENFDEENEEELEVEERSGDKEEDSRDVELNEEKEDKVKESFEEESERSKELEEEKSFEDKEIIQDFLSHVEKENSSEDEESREEYEFDEVEQGLEALDDEFGSEMSISTSFNSSSCINFQNIVYIDFVLPIDSSQSFRYKKELEEVLGTYLIKRNKWWSRKERLMECKLKRVEFLKPIAKDATEVVTCHKCLIEEEAQRLKFDGKNERYPWPFR